MSRFTLPPCVACHRRPALFRGICAACYHRHRAAVRAGETTWTELARDGLAVPAWQGGGSLGGMLLQLALWSACVFAVGLGLTLESAGENWMAGGWVFILVGTGDLLALTVEAIGRHLG